MLEKRNVIIPIVLCYLLFIQFSLFAQKQKTDPRLNLDLSVNDNKGNNDTTKVNYFSVGLVSDKYNQNGVQIETLWSANRRLASGVIIAGLAGVSHEMVGVQISGLNSVAIHQMNGLQLSGLLNVTGQSMKGLQLAAISNLTPKLKGFQFSGISNIVSDELNGAQVCGVVNMAVRAKRSLQLSSLANVCQSTFSGFQMAATNFTDTLKGLQIGLLNVCARHSSGVQIGLLNWSNNPLAHAVGLVNINPSTQIDMMLYVGNASKTNVAIRFRNKIIYTIIGLGTHYLGMNNKFSGCLYYRKGVLFALTPKLGLGGDIGYYHIENFENNDSDTPERMYSLQARVQVEYKLNATYGFFANGGYSLTRYYDKNKFYERKPVIEAGIIFDLIH